jgi:hypothetical protein
MANTGWRQTQADADAAWNARTRAGEPFSPALINDDLFYLSGAVYARNPRTGVYYCNATPNVKDAKGKRITKKLYLAALENAKSTGKDAL